MDKARERGEGLLTPVVELLAGAGVSPNALTGLSLAAAVGAGVAYYLSAFVAGALLVASNSVLDALDGSLARRLEAASRRGDMLDHTVDRFADVAMLVGIAFAAETSLELGLFAVVGVLLTSYMGTQAQAVGAGRVYSGLLGRAYRLTLIMAASLVAGLTPYPAEALNLLLAFFGVVGLLTAVQRFVWTWRGLN